MTDRKLFVPAIAGVLSMGAIAAAAEPTANELRAQIDALNAKVAKIEAREASASQQQATVASVLNDAERRSQLLQAGGMSAGFDGKEFMLGSSDGKFKLVPYFQFQFRNVTNWGEDVKDSGDDSIVNGFEVRRMKLGVKGNAFDPGLKYDIRVAYNRNGGSATLENAFLQYAIADDWAVRAGQWKGNVFHEENVSSGKQLAAERSQLNEILGGALTDYVQGVSLIYSAEEIRGELAFIDGANTDNTNYLDGAGGYGSLSPNYGVEGRMEFKVSGDWKNYDDFSAMGTKSDLLVIGAGFDWTEGGDAHAIAHTVDVQWESGSMPLGLYAAYLGNWSEVGDDDDTYSWGALLQASYMLDDKWEVFGRYGYTDLEGSVDELHEITIGANYYWSGHNAKATLDVSFLPNGSPEDSGLGYQGGEDMQVVIRGQFQLAL